MPTTTCAPVATAVSVTTRRSSSVSAPASPIVPHTTTCSTPASSSVSAFSTSLSGSTAFSSPNGVSRAGMTERMVSLSSFGDVAAHTLDVARGVVGGGVGVTLDDRLVDQAVLGGEQARAAHIGDRLGVQPAPPRLVHRGRHELAHLGEQRIAGH